VAKAADLEVAATVTSLDAALHHVAIQSTRRRRRSVPSQVLAAEHLRGIAAAADAALAAATTANDPVEMVTRVIDDAAAALRIARWDLAEEVLARALGDPLLLAIPPFSACQAQVSLIAGAALASEVTLWRSDRGFRLALICASGAQCSVVDTEQFAQAALEANALMRFDSDRIVAVPIFRGDAIEGVLVVVFSDGKSIDRASTVISPAAARLSLVLERWHLLDWGQARERSLLKASERRLARFGYDLHDGPLQELAALAEEIRLVGADVEQLVVEASRAAVADGFSSLLDQAAQLEQRLRDIAGSLQVPTSYGDALDELLRREVEAFNRRTGISVDVDLDVAAPVLTDSQRIALYRITQEALTNVREHSGASRVSVRLRGEVEGISLTISDDGCGFSAPEVLPAAAARGRLGLVGLAERVRLLGGYFNLSTAPGSGTTVTVQLAHWAPLRAGADSAEF
jgi:two-component system, NarL family, sensor histidine kinase UhpB